MSDPERIERLEHRVDKIEDQLDDAAPAPIRLEKDGLDTSVSFT